MKRLGTGIRWRPEIAGTVERLPGIDWVEVVAENTCPDHLPEALRRLRERGTTVVPHGVSLGLGGAERPDPGRLTALAERAQALGAPLVTEHIAFVRAGGPLTASPRLEAGHMLPVPRTRDALDVLCENVRIAQDALPVPLGLKNTAAPIRWPGEELTEGQFLTELVERTGVRLLIDVANMHSNHINRGEDPITVLGELPLEALAYVHVTGGVEKDGIWYTSYAHPAPQPVLDVLAELCTRVDPPGVLLERNENVTAPSKLESELDTLRRLVSRPALVGAGQEQPKRTAVPLSTPAHLRADTASPAEAAETTRQHLALEQTVLLSALVAGAPPSQGFDQQRLRAQIHTLAIKRADTIAKVAPELPEILGNGYRPAFFGYAQNHPVTGRRRDAPAFTERPLTTGEPRNTRSCGQLDTGRRERSRPAHRSRSLLARLLHRT